MGKEGFFGPATHMYHRHPPTGWSALGGPAAAARLRPGEALSRAASPWEAPAASCGNAHVELRYWRLDRGDGSPRAQRRRRRAAVRARGRGRSLLRLRPSRRSAPATTSSCRAARCGGIECASPSTALLIEATQRLATACRRGAGRPARDLRSRRCSTRRASTTRFRAQQDEQPTGRSCIKRRDQLSTITYPFNPLDARRLARRSRAGAAQRGATSGR